MRPFADRSYIAERSFFVYGLIADLENLEWYQLAIARPKIRILIFLPIPDAGFWICNTFYYIFFYSGRIQRQDGAVLLEDPAEATAEGGHRPATVDNRP